MKMSCLPEGVNWNNKEFTKEMLDYMRAVYCMHPMVLDALDYIDSIESRIAKLVNLVEVQHDDNCHLADMCRQRDASIAELEATIDQLIAAGESLTRVAEWRYANLTELLAWDTLVEKIRKESE